MIVVADTSPLNYLIQLRLAEVLREIYGRVLVPPAVLREMHHKHTPPDVRAWGSDLPAWLEQTPVQQVDSSLDPELGSGEREAISLAVELKADVLLIDELTGRREAEAKHLFVTGTVGVLLQASLLGRCEFADTLKQLRQKRFWLTSSFERLEQITHNYTEAKRRRNQALASWELMADR